MKRLIRLLAILFFLGWLALFGFIGSVYLGIFGAIPTEADLLDIQQDQASLITSSDGVLLGKVFSKNRTDVTYNDLPQHLVDALIATEDARYYEHEGVDGVALMRVLIKTIILQRKNAGGGSTISQQLAKNLFGRESYGPLTMPIIKTKESILANRLESVYTKSEILALYFNTVPFGENVYGIESAAQRYFSKATPELNVGESAVLVGLLKANSFYNPRRNPNNARNRRATVLYQMEKNGYLTPSETEEWINSPLGLKYSNLAIDNPTGYFTDRVKQEVETILEQIKAESGVSYDPKKDGLLIQTTLQSKLQSAAIEARNSHMQYAQKRMNKWWETLSKREEIQHHLHKLLLNSKAYKQAQKRGFNDKSIRDTLSKVSARAFFSWEQTPDMVSPIDSIVHYTKMLQGCLMARENKTGAILAYVGGNSHQFLPYDLVTSEHQMASTFKPFVYAASIQKGATPCDWINNEQKVYPKYNNWTPSNYDNSSGGYYSLRGALA